MLAIWLTVIVVAVAIEIATQVQLVTIWGSLGGIAALIAEILGASPTIQVVVFFVVTLLLLALTRPFVHSMTKKIRNTPTNADMNIGKTGKVTKVIDAEDGLFRVRVGGDDWSAKTADNSVPKVGSSVRIEKIEGVKLIVAPV